MDRGDAVRAYFGNAVRVGSVIGGPPGAFSITSVHVRGPEDIERIRALSRDVAVQMRELDGFMGSVGLTVGDRMVTVTAWSTPEDSKQVRRLAPHREGMKDFYGAGPTAGGWFSVWRPDDMGPPRVRCGACGTLVESAVESESCSCGAPLATERPYC